ncbi:MAG: gas vesicle protein [Bacillota bacterium]|nr:gas vesicle protein [Bacillota bacterium]
MRPLSSNRGSLADLLDRVLDRGVVLRLDLIVSLAGVPLIGVRLNAVIAGMETLLEHGIMADWDEAYRATGKPGVLRGVPAERNYSERAVGLVTGSGRGRQAFADVTSPQPALQLGEGGGNGRQQVPDYEGHHDNAGRVSGAQSS